VARAEEPQFLAVAEDAGAAIFRPGPRDDLWIAGLLRLRGLDVTDDDVAKVRGGSLGRYQEGHQELLLIHGGAKVLEMVRESACRKFPAEGFYLLELFKTLTRNVPRFRNNALRRDLPWDGLMHAVYPPPDELEFIMGSFDHAHRFRDMPMRFDGLHPIRQSFRIFWRLAKLSPFPDLNVPMAWIAMCSWLLSHGYPAIPARREDKVLAERLLRTGPPMRVAEWEHRVLDEVSRI